VEKTLTEDGIAGGGGLLGLRMAWDDVTFDIDDVDD
jgi:hypothetical protein